jgi:hypothetical protein
LQNTLDTLTEDYQTELAFVREEAQKKIAFLRDQISIKDRHIELLHSIISRKD